MKTHAINPKIINLKLFDLFKVFITSIDANAVIIKRKNGMDNIECKLCFKKILLYPLLIPCTQYSMLYSILYYTP